LLKSGVELVMWLSPKPERELSGKSGQPLFLYS